MRRSDGRPWKVLVEPTGQSGDYNMAIDEDLLAESARSGACFLRLYRWDPPTLSVGRNQSLDGIEDWNGPLVRRPTGGKAVRHDQEVTYAVASPIVVFGSLRNAYCEIHTLLAAALRSLGVNAMLAPTRPPARPSAGPASCFASPAGGEILVQGRKVVGSAQVRRGDAFLQHGSILLGGSQPCSQRGSTTLGAVLGRTVTFEEVTAAVIASWGEPLEPPARQPANPSARPVIASLAPR